VFVTILDWYASYRCGVGQTCVTHHRH